MNRINEFKFLTKELEKFESIDLITFEMDKFWQEFLNHKTELRERISELFEWFTEDEKLFVWNYMLNTLILKQCQ